MTWQECRALAAAAGIRDDDLGALIELGRTEFPDDEEAACRRVAETCGAVESGQMTLEQALEPYEAVVDAGLVMLAEERAARGQKKIPLEEVMAELGL